MFASRWGRGFGYENKGTFELKGTCCILIKVVVIGMYTFVKNSLVIAGGGNGNDLIFCLENPMDSEPGDAAMGPKRQTRLSA